MVLDASLSMELQITNVVRMVFLQLCQVKQLVPHLSHHDSTTVMHATFTFILDYYNLLCTGLSLRLTRKLQLAHCCYSTQSTCAA